ncbi:CpaF family protein [Bacillus sp. DTU_2020_1000418_1_SI_GHA_SEK_038]|uniref:CpaF family protein n=1 Tax=Bacillus sp. DTU_2020_1000418_1_SI_GHA_SEK_038 TaxID=3077585 RepID=UPI0028EB9E16|nr:CpaF family protein [Bacillus sp. DTU_2020_1000418_1_SI_GHA_SEK_038]WNS75992.1 CpaF family protein [Bacillus sp. DTU_2020_1000418_1_SI_GHA_SEK_038]
MSWVEKASVLGSKQSALQHDWNISETQVDQLVKHYKSRLIKEANLENITTLTPIDRKRKIERLVKQMIDEEKVIITSDQMEQIIQQIINESVGYGPLESLLRDESITEIMVNGPYEVFIERQGKLEKSNVRFKDNEHVRHIIDRIIAPLGRRIDESSPMVDARLMDGSRVNAVIPPISVDGPSISIRKFKKDPYSLEDLMKFGSFSEDMAEFLKAAVKAKANILVSGGTGSGKTTLLNVLSDSIPQGERIVTIEDMAELRLTYDNLVRLEGRPSNMEGKGEVTIRHLVKNALRMRPDRIIVGEVRGSEAIDMLQAMNTGHEGSLTTIHANSPKDALGRLESMVIMSGLPLTVEVIRGYFVGALDLIVQTSRFSDGKRRIVNIAELVEENGVIFAKDIFRFNRKATLPDGTILGEFEGTGYVPNIYQRFISYGIDFSKHILEAGALK